MILTRSRGLPLLGWGRSIIVLLRRWSLYQCQHSSAQYIHTDSMAVSRTRTWLYPYCCGGGVGCP